MTAPYYADHDVTLWQGDATTVLAGIPDGSVNCAVTSPPYFGLRDYGVDGQLGMEATPAEYVAALASVFAQVRRVLADDGTLWLNIGDSYSGGNRSTYDVEGGKTRARGHALTRPVGVLPEKNLLGAPWRVAFALRDDGWTLRNAIIWHKPNAMPESTKDRLSNRYEHLFLFAKSRRYYFDLGAIKVPMTGRAAGNSVENRQKYGRDAGPDDVRGRRFGGNATSTLLDVHETRNPGDVWAIPTAPFPGAHFACMPPELARRCILAGCPEGGMVLDPFAGAGTTLMVARQLARRSVGIELNPAYCDLAVQRIGDTPFDFGETA